MPKATPLKRAFQKLWTIYATPLKLYMQAESDETNVVYRTPSLSLQLIGARNQDHVPWGEMDKVRVKLPCVHACLDNANAVT